MSADGARLRPGSPITPRIEALIDETTDLIVNRLAAPPPRGAGEDPNAWRYAIVRNIVKRCAWQVELIVTADDQARLEKRAIAKEQRRRQLGWR